MRKTKNVLVTGSAGIIGTNLTKKLLLLGYRVIGVDNFYSSSEENIKPFQDNPRFHFIRHDIRKPLKVEQNVEAIYNLASPASLPFIRKDPIFTLETSTLGVKNMLELARRHSAKLLEASTSEVYGDPLEHPQKESYRGNVNTIGPRSVYDEGKRVAETLCYEYFNQGVDVAVVRIFNTYGPYMNPADGRVISNFIVQALKDENLTLYGRGGQTRSFCYVDDLTEAMISYMNLKSRELGPINLGNPKEITIIKLARLILKLVPDSKSTIIYKPLPKDDPRRRRPDITRAKRILNWQPRTTLEEGLKKTIDYFKGI